ncbi:MAG: SUMF1/EgtB/PvdO family nonheme iron enzyme [Gammaproteobacteria bacterium]
MSLKTLLQQGLDIALDGRFLRVFASNVAGDLVGALTEPAIKAFRQHFTLSGHELGDAFGASLVRALAAIDAELNGGRLSKMLGPLHQRQYQARLQAEFFAPFAAERQLSQPEQNALCARISTVCGQLSDAKDRIFIPAAFPEPDLAALLSDALPESSSAVLLAQIRASAGFELPTDSVDFFAYRNLLGDAVLYFFREQLRRDERVQRTMNALQSQGIWQDVHALGDKLDGVDQRLNQRLQAEARAHREHLQRFQSQFADWSRLLDWRLDDIRDQLDQNTAKLDQILAYLQAQGLDVRIKAEDEFGNYSPEFVQRIEQATAELRLSARYRARAALIHASVLAASGDNARAETSLKEALTVAQTNADKALAHYNLFHVYLHRPDHDSALSHLQEAIALNPEYALWRTDKYEVEKILGAGGMGCAFLARNRLDQQVVLKTLWDASETASRQFFAEAKTMVRIAGAYVPQPRDFDYADPAHKKRPYIEMEYLDAALDGDAWLKQHGKLSLKDGLAVGRQIARGLALAHGQNICHYDLKPANLLLRRASQSVEAKIIDFGLSNSVLALQQKLSRSHRSGKSTFAQQVFGSLDYAPPEQRGEGGQPGPQSDLYAFGVTLYRLLTGQSATKPNPRYLRDSPELHDLIFDCITDDPAQRPASAVEVAERLERMLDESVPVAKQNPQPVIIQPPPAPTPPAIQNIHGWSTDQVQALQRQTAEVQGLEVTFQDRLRDSSVGPEMVVIPAGIFLMGSPESEEGRSDNEYHHEVTIAKPFAVGKYAVTFDEYDEFCAATGRRKSRCGGIWGWGRGRRPVINVSSIDAMAYCAWLAFQTGQSYRLLTEVEWEYACRAGTATPFYFGATIGTDQANYDGNYNYGQGKRGEYRQKTVPVGQFPPNAWGLYDMHGNVWEWTGSRYQSDYDGSEQRLFNEQDLASAKPPGFFGKLFGSGKGDTYQWVVRGGSWLNDPQWMRSAYRTKDTAVYRSYALGFRPARSI